MAKYRYVNTKFWSDSYIVNLDYAERYLFLYLLTNEHTDISGVYEIPLKIMSFETGIESDMLLRMIERLENDDKVFYQEGWIAIKNFSKHQVKNPKVSRGIEIGLEKAPENMVRWLQFDSLPSPIDSLSYSNTNTNTNREYNEDAPDFLTNKEKQEDAVKVFAKGGVKEEDARAEVEKFVEYWMAEDERTGIKRWETTHHWNTKNRLDSWVGKTKLFANFNSEDAKYFRVIGPYKFKTKEELQKAEKEGKIQWVESMGKGKYIYK